jgi:hypothetical protein
MALVNASHSQVPKVSRASPTRSGRLVKKPTMFSIIPLTISGSRANHSPMPANHSPTPAKNSPMLAAASVRNPLIASPMPEKNPLADSPALLKSRESRKSPTATAARTSDSIRS